MNINEGNIITLKVSKADSDSKIVFDKHFDGDFTFAKFLVQKILANGDLLLLSPEQLFSIQATLNEAKNKSGNSTYFNKYYGLGNLKEDLWNWWSMVITNAEDYIVEVLKK